MAQPTQSAQPYSYDSIAALEDCLQKAQQQCADLAWILANLRDQRTMNALHNCAETVKAQAAWR